MFRHYSLKQKIFMIATICFYLFFMYMVINAAITDKKSVASIAFIIIGVVALIFGSLNEYLKLQYNEALWQLNFKLDPDKANQIYDSLIKKDIFGQFKKDRCLFDVMVALEKKQPEKVLNIINNNEKKFNANVETLLIRLYYEMRSYLLLGRSKNINEIYMDVQNIEKMKRKPNIFQFDEFHAMKQLAINNKGRAYDHFKNVNMKYMNPKEQKYILENLVSLAPRGEVDNYKDQLNKLLEIVDESK